MATHPYISGPGNLVQMVNHLRKTFPTTITAETVKRLGIAPNNESYVINALQFVGVIDGEGKRTAKATDIFHSGDDEFARAFGELVQSAYQELFGLYGDEAWDQPKEKLLSFFRRADQTSEVIGQRQVGTFLALAALSGHERPADTGKKSGERAPPRPAKVPNPKTRTKRAEAEKAGTTSRDVPPSIREGVSLKRDMAMTVRIEINLPSDGTRETYDTIFKSIRANLIDE